MGMLLDPYTLFRSGGNATAISIYNKIVSWWERDEAAGSTIMFDRHINALHGTYTGLTPGAAGMTANLGKSVTFPAGNNYADVPNNALLNITGDVSISLWAKRNGVQGNFPKLMWKPTDTVNGKGTYQLFQDNFSNGGRVAFRVNIAGAYYNVSDPTPLADATVTHFIGSRTGTSLDIWKNGVQVATAGSIPSGALDTAANSMRWGYVVGAGDIWIGGQDQAIVFSPSLTNSEKLYINNTNLGISYAALRAAASIGNTFLDDFSSNTIANYTEFAGTTATWAVSGGFLQPTTVSAQSILTRNDISFKNGEVSASLTQADDAGIALRVQDVNNYYMVAISDASATTGTPNTVRLWKRVAGTFTALTPNIAIAFVRGTAHTLTLRANGIGFQVDFDGANLATVTDSAIGTIGKIGARCNGSITPKFDSLSALLPPVSAGDPYWANVVSLLHFEGANNSTIFTDVIGVPWTANGNAKLDTTAPIFGTASGVFDGTGDYIVTPSTAVFQITGDYTIESWLRPDVNTSIRIIASKRATPSNSNEWSFFIGATGKLSIVVWGATGVPIVVNLVGATTITTGVNHHVAVTRAGAIWRLFVDGILDGTATESAVPNVAAYDVCIGRDVTNTARDFDGHKDEFRFTKGIARYTATFVPPTSPFPDGL